MSLIDQYLNKVSMYRLMIQYLAGILTLAVVLAAVGVLSYNPWHIIFTAVYFVLACTVFNAVFVKLAGTQTNLESVFITALILALIFGPGPFIANFALFTFVAFAAMASKYLIVWKRRHLFNPAAFAAVAAALLFANGASWWVGSIYLLPVILLGGIILMRKIANWHLVASFLAAYLIFTILFNPQLLQSFAGALEFIFQILIYTSILFFGFVMLPEPQTSPNRKYKRIWYGVFTAFVLILLQNYTDIFYSLELSLLAGNLFAFIISYEIRTNAILKRREKIAPNIENFWFYPEYKFDFKPGQFLEWTNYHKKADNRGIRRYFTIASSPTEDTILLTTKFAENGSTFKKSLANMHEGDKAIVTGPEGDFILPKNIGQKLVFIAGGIGITPFRSMIKYCLDKNEKRSIVLIYAAGKKKEFVFEDIFTQAQDKLNMKTVYTNDLIDKKMIEENVIDMDESLFYVSGPESMVRAMEKNLAELGVKPDKIKHDYFPGYQEI